MAKHWPNVPCLTDVRTIDASGLGRIDCVTGGYPCQPFSNAGKRQGAEDDRHLWPAMFAVIKDTRPRWVIGENVAGHISMGLDDVLSDLEAEGYTARTFVIPACAVDAKHRRDRVWIVANADKPRPQRRISEELPKRPGKRPVRQISASEFKCEWLPEPAVGRVASGISRRVDRLRALGNAVVPQIPELIGHAILQAEKET